MDGQGQGETAPTSSERGGHAQEGSHHRGPYLPGHPYDGHALAAQIEQTTTLLQDLDVKPATAVVDLGYTQAPITGCPPPLCIAGPLQDELRL